MPAVAERLPWTLRAYQRFAAMATPMARLVLAKPLETPQGVPAELAERHMPPLTRPTRGDHLIGDQCLFWGSLLDKASRSS
jgi:hypothetical protein